jgi:hypothetical protein
MCANPVDRNHLVRIMNKQLTMINFARILQVPMNGQRLFSEVIKIFLERIGCLNSIYRNSYWFHRGRREHLHRLLRLISPDPVWTT